MRTHSMMVRLTPEMHEEFENLANGLGVPASTMATVVIGQWVREQNMRMDLTNDVVSRITPNIMAAAQKVVESEIKEFPNPNNQ